MQVTLDQFNRSRWSTGDRWPGFAYTDKWPGSADTRSCGLIVDGARGGHGRLAHWGGTDMAPLWCRHGQPRGRATRMARMRLACRTVRLDSGGTWPNGCRCSTHLAWRWAREAAQRSGMGWGLHRTTRRTSRGARHWGSSGGGLQLAVVTVVWMRLLRKEQWSSVSGT